VPYRCEALYKLTAKIEKLKKGHKAGNKTFKVHLDGEIFFPTSAAIRRKGRARTTFTSTTAVS